MTRNRYRVLYIEKPPFLGGSTIGLYELVRGLDKSEYEPIILFHGPNPYRQQFRDLGLQVLTLSEASPAASEAISSRDVAASLGRFSQGLADGYRAAKQLYAFTRFDLPVARRVAHLMKEQAIDLVHHNNNLPGNRATVVAASLAGLPQVCHVRMLHRFGFIEKYLARFVNAFIYMSTAIEQVYRQLGVPASKGHVVFDAFEATDYETASRPSAVRAEFGLTDADCVIANVGRIEWWKGQDYFIQAMAQVTKKQPRAKALIVGSPAPTPRGRAYFQRLQELVKDLNLSDNVIFTGFRHDVSQLMAAADVIVHSSSEPEPFGRVVVEAMMAGRPVVATAAGGVLDIVEDQTTGLLVPIQDPTAMAQAISQLLDDQQRARIMGQRAAARARERFSVNQHVARVQHIYESILSGQGGDDYLGGN